MAHSLSMEPTKPNNQHKPRQAVTDAQGATGNIQAGPGSCTASEGQHIPGNIRGISIKNSPEAVKLRRLFAYKKLFENVGKFGHADI